MKAKFLILAALFSTLMVFLFYKGMQALCLSEHEESRHKDLGEVFLEDVEELEGNFRVLNTHDNPVRFSVQSQSCGCSSVSLDQDEIQPGQYAKLRMKSRISPVEGKKVFHVMIKSHLADHQTFTVSANVI